LNDEVPEHLRSLVQEENEKTKQTEEGKKKKQENSDVRVLHQQEEHTFTLPNKTTLDELMVLLIFIIKLFGFNKKRLIFAFFFP
jgi:hypothetical protein